MSGVTNNRFFGARSWQEAKRVLLHPKFFEGFRDFADGQPFDYAKLDGWPLLDQHRYENGRELAAECRAAGLAIRWGNRSRIPQALKAVVTERARQRRPCGPPQAEAAGASVRIADRLPDRPAG